MNRKKFIKSISVASVGAAVISTLSVAKSTLLDEPSIIKPPKLKKGDKLAIVAPGSYISESELQDSINNIQALGFETNLSAPHNHQKSKNNERVKQKKVEKVKDLGRIEQWTKGGWTIFILAGYNNLNEAKAALVSAQNRGFKTAEVVIDNGGILERLKQN